MTYVQYFIAGVCALDALLLGYTFDVGQYLVWHAVERSCDQRGADGARRVARAKPNHAPPLAHRDRGCPAQIARQIEDVARVVLADYTDLQRHQTC
jgi:hypothetical protein